MNEGKGVLALHRFLAGAPASEQGRFIAKKKKKGDLR